MSLHHITLFFHKLKGVSLLAIFELKTRGEQYVVDVDLNVLINDLALAPPGDETDNQIEQLILCVFEAESDIAVSALIKALELAKSPFVKSRVSTALVLASPNNNSIADINIAEAIVSAIKNSQEDDFLYAEMFKTLGILATQNIFAFAEVTKILQKLDIENESEFLIISAIKVIGWLEIARRDNTIDLRSKLQSFSRSENSFILSEVYYQQAILAVSDALLVDNQNTLKMALQEASVIFQRSAALEEQREDAQAFVLLLDLILEYLSLTLENRESVIPSISEKSQGLIRFICDPCHHSWHDYRNQHEQTFMLRVWRIAELLQRTAISVSRSDEWTNFNEALVELVATYTLLLNTDNQLYRVDDAFNEIGSKIIQPKLGSFLRTTVGLVRFEKVIEYYVASTDEDNIAEGLRALYAFIREYELSIGKVPESQIEKLTNIAEQTGQPLDFFLTSLLEAYEKGMMKNWFDSYGYSQPLLSIDNPGMLGNEPRVDKTVRSLMKIIAHRLGQDYPRNTWKRIIDVCVALVQIVQKIRDDLPLYTLSTDDEKGNKSGRGQQANEADLQEDLFNRLRHIFGDAVGYEISGLGGGRSDLGLKFSGECEFPIEVKAEYHNIERAHIHSSYLIQSDIYASMRDRIAFLMILDVRACNEGKQKKSLKRNKVPTSGKEASTMPVKLYTLEESFWIDSLPIDPQIQGATPNVVIIGLVPANRRKPSSLTQYSKKPKRGDRTTA
jgi:hypothetical protein